MKSTTADRLKEIMKCYNLRQIDILKRAEPYCKQYNIKLGRNDISQYVSGKVAPGQEKLTILSLALGVSETWLMGYDVPMDRQRNVLTIDTRVDDTPYNRALQKLQDKKELTSEEIRSIKDELPKALQSVKNAFSKAYNNIDDANKKKLINYYDQLNEDGKSKLLERAEELTMISIYCEETPDYLQPMAAHERTDVEITKEGLENDDAIMDDEEFWSK